MVPWHSGNPTLVIYSYKLQRATTRVALVVSHLSYNILLVYYNRTSPSDYLHHQQKLSFCFVSVLTSTFPLSAIDTRDKPLIFSAKWISKQISSSTTRSA